MDDSSEFEWHEVLEDDFKISPRRYKKLKLYADANIPSPVVEELRNAGIPTKTAVEDGIASHPDQKIYQRAKDIGRVLLTMDRDFWNDRVHPLQKGPGVFYIDISPDQPEEAVDALARFYVYAEYVPLDWWKDMKVRVTKSGFITRSRVYEGTVEDHEFCYTDDGRLLTRRLKLNRI